MSVPCQMSSLICQTFRMKTIHCNIKTEFIILPPPISYWLSSGCFPRDTAITTVAWWWWWRWCRRRRRWYQMFYFCCIRIRRMKRSGILKRLHAVFYPIKEPISEIPRPVVYFVQVTPILTLLGTATLVAIVLLLVENKAAYIKACLQLGRQKLNQLLYGMILVSPAQARKRQQI